MLPALWIPDKRLRRRLVALVLALAVGTGCEQTPVGVQCYQMDLVFDGPVPDPTAGYVQRMLTDQGSLAGLMVQDWLASDCRYRVLRVSGSLAETVLCIPPDSRGDQMVRVAAGAGGLGGGLYLVGTLPADAQIEGGRVLCWDSPVTYELRDVVTGLQKTFSSTYNLVRIVRSDRFLGGTEPCGSNPPGARMLALIDDTGQVVREHPEFPDTSFTKIDPMTRDYFLYTFPDSPVTYEGFDPDGEELPLVIGDAPNCSMVGALAGIQSFVCRQEGDARSLVIGRPGGPTASVDLGPDYRDAALGGQGSVVAVLLDSGQLEVYDYAHDQLELLWKKASHDAAEVYVGLRADPLIAVRSNDGALHVFDVQGRSVMTAASYADPIVGNVGGFLTLFGERIQTYRITRASACTASDES